MTTTKSIQNLKRGDRVVCPDGAVRVVQQVTFSNVGLEATVSFQGMLYTLDRRPHVTVEVMA